MLICTSLKLFGHWSVRVKLRGNSSIKSRRVVPLWPKKRGVVGPALLNQVCNVGDQSGCQWTYELGSEPEKWWYIFNGSSTLNNFFSNNKSPLQHRPDYNSNVGIKWFIQILIFSSIHFSNIYWTPTTCNGQDLICKTYRDILTWQKNSFFSIRWLL